MHSAFFYASKVAWWLLEPLNALILLQICQILLGMLFGR